MAKEIERKFLVSGNGWRKKAGRSKAIQQAYLASTRELSIRVRTIGKKKALLTIKSEETSIVRSEYEYEIPIKDAQRLMKLRTGRVIVKDRHIVKVGKSCFEVDVFRGAHRGLIIAEIELPSPDAEFERPKWLGKEVTGKKQYYNANMARSR